MDNSKQTLSSVNLSSVQFVERSRVYTPVESQSLSQPIKAVDIDSLSMSQMGAMYDSFFERHLSCVCFFAESCECCESISSSFNLLPVVDCAVCVLSSRVAYDRASSSELADYLLDTPDSFRCVSSGDVFHRSEEILCPFPFDSVYPFDHSLWQPGLYTHESFSQLNQLLPRPPIGKGITHALLYLDSLMFEYYQRTFNEDQIRYAYRIYVVNRSYVINQKHPYHHVTSGSRRAGRRACSVIIPRPPKPPLPESSAIPTPEVPLSQISDYIFDSETITLGPFHNLSRVDLSREPFTSIFSRNKPLLRDLMDQQRSLRSFQTLLTQKFLSDNNFRSRILRHHRTLIAECDTPLQTEMATLQSGRERFPSDSSSEIRAAEYAYRRDLNAIRLPSVSSDSPWMDVASFTTMLARMGTTLHLLVNADSHLERIEIVFLYVSGLGVESLTEVAQRLMETEVFQSGPAEELFNQTLAVLGVANILTLVKDTPPSVFDFFHRRFVSLARRSDGDEVLSKFWKSFKSVMAAFIECFKTGSISPLFSDGDSPEDVLFEAEALVTYRNEVSGLTHDSKAVTMATLREKGSIPKWWTRTFLGEEFLVRMREVIDKLDKVIPLVGQAVRTLYTNARGRLFVLVSSSVNNLTTNARRIQPLGVVLTGPPGSGKTNLIQAISRFIGRSQGYATDASAVYHYQPTANFQDGLNPGHWVIVGDDLDHNCKVVAPGVFNHVDAIMTIVDNKAFPVESANVTEKGTNYARPLLYVHATNFENLRLTGFSPDHSAIHRRLPIKLRLSAKPEYSSGKFLDSSKINGQVDIHDIEISVYDKVSGEYAVIQHSATTTQALRFVLRSFKANLAAQLHMFDEHGAGECQTCFIPLPRGQSVCSDCASVQLQGANISAPLHDVSVAANNVRAISDQVIERNLVAKVDRVVERLDSSLAPSATFATVYKSLADFVTDKPQYAIGLAGLLGVVTFFINTYRFQGRVNNSTQQAPIDFVKASDVKPLGTPFRQVTYTESELMSRIRDNLGKIVSGEREAYVTRIGLDVFLANRHALAPEGGRVVFRGLSYDVKDSPDVVARIGNKDVILIKIPGVPASPTLLPMFWPEFDMSYTTFDSAFLVTPDGTLPTTRNRIRYESFHGTSGYALATDAETREGHCGLPMVAKVGNAFRIVGIHHAATQTLGFGGIVREARAPLVSRSELNLAAATIAASLQSAALLTTCFPKGLVQQDLPPPAKSELALAISRGAEVVNLGHDPGSVGFSAHKSKCQNSLMYGEVEAWTRDLLGEPHYWQVPHLKGKMIDDQWHSGYQNIFKGYSNTESYSKFYRPILDYMDGIDELDTSGYAALSLDECIRGVDLSLINPVNLSTSVGPPASGPKSRHMTNQGYMSKEVFEQVLEIEACIADGIIPIPLSTLSLKDEPVKYSKNQKRDIRTINCLPAAFNLVTKKYLAPIKVFMRHNGFFFESMVGIDMSFDGGQLIYDRFRIADPTLENVIEGDFRKMDKMINGTCAWAVVEVFAHIASVIGVDVAAVRTMVWAQFNVIYSIQGDMFQTGACNPSGGDLTVEINAVVNSLTHRASWCEGAGLYTTVQDYVAKRLKPAPMFRQEVSLVTYGDDFLACVAQRFPLEAYFERFKGYGHDVTDGQKLDRPIYRNFFAASFLKRNFYLVDGFVRSGLMLPSILRMISVLKPSKLAVKEQCAIVLEEAIREIFLNISLDYSLWLARFRSLADKYSLWDSRYLMLAEKPTYERMWQERTFSTWSIVPQSPDASVELQSGLPVLKGAFQQTKMQNLPPTTSAMGDETMSSSATSVVSILPDLAPHQSQPTPTTYGAMVAGGDGDTTLDHASGDILSLSAPVVGGSLGNTRTDQRMPDVQYADALHRNVLIGRIVTSSFTSAGSVLQLQPWKQWILNTFVFEKLSHFQYCKGSLIISGTLRAPSLSSGLVVITFCPGYETAGAYSSPVQLCCVPPHVVVDLAVSSDFEFTLPWVVSSDWGNLTDQLFAKYWNMDVRVVVPLVTNVPDGCVSASLNVFARPGPDFQLSGASFESGRPTKATRLATRTPSYNSMNMSKPAASKPAVSTSFTPPSGTAQTTVNAAVTKATGYKPSDLLKKAGGIGLAMAPVPIIGEFAAAVGAASSIAGAWAEWFGFTRKSVVPPLVETAPRAATNMISCDVDDGSVKASLFSTNALSIDPAINGTMSALDETSVAFIGSRYTLIGSLTYTTGSESDQDRVIPVTPCIGSFNISDTQYTPSTAGYIAGKFAFWRGDMKYILYPVVSSVHRGSLQIIWQPVPRSATTTGEDITNLSVNTIVDIAAATPIELTVGYSNDNPMCYTDFYALDTPMTFADYFTLNGYLRVRFINPVVGPVCAQDIQILVFAASGENMEFAQPVEEVLIEGTPLLWGRDIDISVVMQSATVGAAPSNMISIDLLPSSGEYPIDDILAGERIRSLRALVQKPSPIWSEALIDIVGQYEVWAHTPFRTADPVNYMNYFGSMFLAFAGGIRYKYLAIANRVGGVDVTLDYPLICNNVCAVGSMPLCQLNPSTIGVGDIITTEVTVPYCHVEKWVPAYKDNQLLYDSAYLQSPVVNTIVNRAVYRCAAADCRLTFFRSQNIWLIQDNDEFNDVNIICGVRINSTTPPSLARKAEESAPRPRREMTLTQYRARTGREAFKVTDRTSRRVAQKKSQSPQFLTEEQAIREDAVA